MKLVTDLDEIKRLSRQKEEENWGFRSFLKSGVISNKKIDLIAQKLYKQIVARVDCKACGKCCNVTETKVKEEDIEPLSKRLNLSREEFEAQYLVTDHEGKSIINKMPCPFLEGKECSVYEDRPESCHSYPHILNKSLVPRLINVIKNCAVCPIVFNLYEQLKSEIWSMNDSFDDFDEDDYL
jgi:Fe-S-cluster containining protein